MAGDTSWLGQAGSRDKAAHRRAGRANRGDKDIATGAPDNDNGRFTEMGWAKPFDAHGSMTKTVTWELGQPPTGLTHDPMPEDDTIRGTERDRGPTPDNPRDPGRTAPGDPHCPPTRRHSPPAADHDRLRHHPAGEGGVDVRRRRCRLCPRPLHLLDRCHVTLPRSTVVEINKDTQEDTTPPAVVDGLQDHLPEGPFLTGKSLDEAFTTKGWSATAYLAKNTITVVLVAMGQ